jgi:hypothetical protein
MKQMLAAIFGAVAPMTGATKYTLTSLSYDGVDRIAHLTTTLSGQMNQAPGTPGDEAAGPGFGMKMSGEGTMEVNLDRGFAQVSEQVITLDALMPSRAMAGVTTPPMRMHGTVKLSSTAVPD